MATEKMATDSNASALNTYFTLGAAFACLAVAAFFLLRKLFPKNLPPGPPALPIVGHLPQLFPDPAAAIAKWSKKYGDTVSVQYGPKLLVVMHDFDTAKKMFNEEITTGRDPDYPQNTFAKGRGIQQSEGDLWREHRRFMTRTLRDYGLGKSWLQDTILNEIEDNFTYFTKHAKDPVDPRGYIEHFTANIVSLLAFGKRYEINDKEYNRFTEAFAQNTRLLGPPLTPVYLYPWIKHIIPEYKANWNKFYNNWRTYMPFAEKRIKERKEHSIQSDTPENYVDSYFEEAKKHQGEPNNTFTDDQLLYSMINMYTAGTASVTTTLLWCFLYMLENPEEQKKIQAEIDSIVEPDKLVRMEDRANLKYTDAALMECQRLASIVPLGLFHQNLEEMTIDGFTIPKRSLLSASVYSIHRDPRYWEHPDKFYPGHFLDKEGNVKQSPPGYMPFGIGKRLCNGEPLAKMEVWLYMTNMLHKYEFRKAEGCPASSEVFTTGLARTTWPYKCVFVPRHTSRNGHVHHEKNGGSSIPI
ncbi:cytochrome P450 2J4-like [Paramacrobiotus metropolitanus]|uniref:cytochrome P450 2J4-like n=1 Tax=Paramacrobiotus metropolitanus TaxID=2943436 RepID=UPI0024465374|nr:cytochrome P450 2J4-like [Paramacrobiotus metropolitanus]